MIKSKELLFLISCFAQRTEDRESNASNC